MLVHEVDLHRSWSVSARGKCERSKNLEVGTWDLGLGISSMHEAFIQDPKGQIPLFSSTRYSLREAK